VAISLNNLSLLYDQEEGAYAKAEPLYIRTLDIREKSWVRCIPKWRTASTTSPCSTRRKVAASPTSPGPSLLIPALGTLAR